jgi:hypothetical protein
MSAQIESSTPVRLSAVPCQGSVSHPVAFEIHNGMYLKEFMSKETLFDEHKEFSIGVNDLSQNNKINSYVERGIVDDDLNNAVLSSIGDYVTKYFPKYLTTFLNSDKDRTKKHGVGYLNFGVCDDGFITGIPIMNGQHDAIKTIISTSINTLVNNKKIFAMCDNHQNVSSVIINSVLKRIVVEIHDLSHDDNENNKNQQNYIQSLIVETQQQIIEFNKWRRNMLRKMKIYNRQYGKWIDLMNKYSAKKVTVLDDKDIRYEFIDFMRDNYQGMNNDTRKGDGAYIHIKDFCHREIYLSLQEYDEYIMLFRDTKRTALMKNKPVKPNEYIPNPQINALRRLTPLIDQFISNNQNLRYILIRFRIPLITIPNCSFAYLDKGVYNIKRRVNKIVNGRVEPECQS